MASHRPGVLLDVDGTLVDTNYLHALAWSRAFADVGEWAPMNAIHRLIGMGGDQLVGKVLGHDNDAASERRAVHYRELQGDIRAFPGATSLLSTLRTAGLRIVIATSSPKDELEVVVDLLGLNALVDAITTADDVSSSKPDPEVFLVAAEAGGVDLRRAVVIGDSVWDVEGANAAGVACLAVESGGFSRHELSEAGARSVYRDVAELDRQFHSSVLALLAAPSQSAP